MGPLVSVVIPAYNAGAFIDASVGSALSQTAGDMEVIIVDDGSTDGTPDRLRSWNDPRLMVITQTHQGLASALNTGIASSRGAYVGFLDADDVWLPGKLVRHIQLLQERPDVDVTFSWVRAVDVSGKPIRWHCPSWRGTVSLPQLLADYMIRTMSAVVTPRLRKPERSIRAWCVAWISSFFFGLPCCGPTTFVRFRKC
jgi:glycosyltransferase involved in cell wall biosynthesis